MESIYAKICSFFKPSKEELKHFEGYKRKHGKALALHIHSKYSRCGALSPKSIAKYSKELGFDGFSITDHDNADSVNEAMSIAKKYSLVSIPGIEHTASPRKYLYLGKSRTFSGHLGFYFKKSMNSQKIRKLMRIDNGSMDSLLKLLKEVKKCGVVIANHVDIFSGIGEIGLKFLVVKNLVDGIESYNFGARSRCAFPGLAKLGAMDAHGMPFHGIATIVPRLKNANDFIEAVKRRRTIVYVSKNESELAKARTIAYLRFLHPKALFGSFFAEHEMIETGVAGLLRKD